MTAPVVPRWIVVVATSTVACRLEVLTLLRYWLIAYTITPAAVTAHAAASSSAPPRLAGRPRRRGTVGRLRVTCTWSSLVGVSRGGTLRGRGIHAPARCLLEPHRRRLRDRRIAQPEEREEV